MAKRAARKTDDQDKAVSLELGRRLFGGSKLPDDECWSQIQRWYRTEGYQAQIPIEELPVAYLEKLLRLALEGIHGDLVIIRDESALPTESMVFELLPNDEISAFPDQSAFAEFFDDQESALPAVDSVKFAVLVPAHLKQKSHGFTDQEIDALNAYLRSRIEGIEDSAPVGALEEKFRRERIRWIIEDSPISNAPIESQEFQSSAMNAFPSRVIPDLASLAKMSISEARKLTFFQLVLAARAAREATQGKKKEPTKSWSHAQEQRGRQLLDKNPRITQDDFLRTMSMNRKNANDLWHSLNGTKPKKRNME